MEDRNRRREELRAARVAALAVGAFVLLVPPFLARFDRPGLILGVPALGAYLFAVWAVLIGAVAATVHGGDATSQADQQQDERSASAEHVSETG